MIFKVSEYSKDAHFAISFKWMTPWEDDDDRHNIINLHVGRRSVWIKIPEIIKPKEKWLTIDGKQYRDTIQRSYGFSFFEDALHLSYGIQPGCWCQDDPENSDHTKVLFYFWNYDFVDQKVFDINQERYVTGKKWRELRDQMYRRENNFSTLPKTDFLVYEFFTYYDPHNNCNVFAKAYVEEYSWIRGKYKWMKSIFGLFDRFRLVRRSLNVEFSDETGPRKGSWKGGTIGCSLDMIPGESTEAAIERFKQEWPAKA